MRLVFLITIFLLVTASATTINLEANQTQLLPDQEIKFHLEIYPSKPIGGKFSIYQEISDRKFRIVRTLLSNPYPGQCYTCAGGYPLSEDLDRNFYFKPKTTGNYYAEANFGHVQEKVDFTVVSPTTTTTSTTSTTSISSSTTTSSTSTTSSTTSTSSTTTTLIQENKGCSSCTYSWLISLIAIIILLIFIKFIPK